MCQMVSEFSGSPGTWPAERIMFRSSALHGRLAGTTTRSSWLRLGSSSLAQPWHNLGTALAQPWQCTKQLYQVIPGPNSFIFGCLFLGTGSVMVTCSIRIMRLLGHRRTASGRVRLEQCFTTLEVWDWLVIDLLVLHVAMHITFRRQTSCAWLCPNRAWHGTTMAGSIIGRTFCFRHDGVHQQFA